MKSHLTQQFVNCFQSLPERIKNLARKNYRLWKLNHYYPSLHFKEIKPGTNIYSVRIGIGYRAIGILDNDNIVWFWIGSHEEYNKIIN